MGSVSGVVCCTIVVLTTVVLSESSKRADPGKVNVKT